MTAARQCGPPTPRSEAAPPPEMPPNAHLMPITALPKGYPRGCSDPFRRDNI
ncbi:hypothetical protein ABIA31_009404 [Catenulispora sp. MAP5-51]